MAENAFSGSIVITGGGSTLGMAIATALRERGASTVSVCGRESSLERCRAAGLPCLPFAEPEDLAERVAQCTGEAVESVVDCRHSRFESLLAGASPEAIMRWAAEDIGERARFVRAMGRAMLSRRRGRCVFISSVAAGYPAAGQGYYAAAKCAGEALYQTLAAELGGRGITTCSLRLSWLDAGRGQAFLEGCQEAVNARMPLGRVVSLAEAVDTVVFLLSPAARSINAAVVTLDGGLSGSKGRKGQ